MTIYNTKTLLDTDCFQGIDLLGGKDNYFGKSQLSICYEPDTSDYVAEVDIEKWKATET